MGGMVKSVAKIFGGGSKQAPQRTIMDQNPAPSAPVASAATAPAGPEATVGSQVGSMGASETKKSSRRRGRMETLLSELGGSVERFGD